MKGIEVRLGSVPGGAGELQISVVVEEDRRVWIELYASPFGGGRGVLLRISQDTLVNLRAKLDEAEATIVRIRAGMLG